MTGLATLMSARGSWVSFDRVVVFHVTLVPLFMTLHTGFGTHIAFITSDALSCAEQYDGNNNGDKGKHLFCHPDYLLRNMSFFRI
jgi:hypothetical protein